VSPASMFGVTAEYCQGGPSPEGGPSPANDLPRGGAAKNLDLLPFRRVRPMAAGRDAKYWALSPSLPKEREGPQLFPCEAAFC